MQATLFLMFGYPGSGKSTLARQLSNQLENVCRVSYDELRERMWPDGDAKVVSGYSGLVIGALDYAAEQLLGAGVSVIYDVNNNRTQQRVATAALAARNQARTIVVWVQTPLDISRHREGTRALIENHRMSAEKYEGLVAAMEDPRSSETVIVIDGQETATQQLESFERQLAALAAEAVWN